MNSIVCPPDQVEQLRTKVFGTFSPEVVHEASGFQRVKGKHGIISYFLGGKR